MCRVVNDEWFGAVRANDGVSGTCCDVDREFGASPAGIVGCAVVRTRITVQLLLKKGP